MLLGCASCGPCILQFIPQDKIYKALGMFSMPTSSILYYHVHFLIKSCVYTSYAIAHTLRIVNQAPPPRLQPVYGKTTTAATRKRFFRQKSQFLSFHSLSKGPF